MTKLYTVKEIAEYLNIHRETVRVWRINGMPCIKIGRNVRFDINEVNKWLRGNK